MNILARIKFKLVELRDGVRWYVSLPAMLSRETAIREIVTDTLKATEANCDEALAALQLHQCSTVKGHPVAASRCRMCAVLIKHGMEKLQ